MPRFLHTADWPLGKPFSRIPETDQRRARVQLARFEVLDRLRALIAERQLEFVLVAGDLFDTPTVSRATLAAACERIGKLGVPVLVIPGNHDPGGPGSVWLQPAFHEERSRRAPNLQFLGQPEPVILPSALVFPCPLGRRHEAEDPTLWLQDGLPASLTQSPLPRIVLAHGSVQGFGNDADEEESVVAANRIALERLPAGTFDYVALGDWHGTKQVSPCAWYSGTPEPDRFPKGSDHAQGQVLIVELDGHGLPPRVEPVPTAQLHWHRLTRSLQGAADLDGLESDVESLTRGSAGRDLLDLELSGALGLGDRARLEGLLDRWEAACLRVKRDLRLTLQPTGEELASLASRPGDPLLSTVAHQLLGELHSGGESAEVARHALQQLHAALATT
jgi:DNA repair exonuclease SbcCD nuclease subunit